MTDYVDFLRKLLQKLSPSGPAGFEGLIASCLTAFTGNTFRLAKSGLQFGRDASTQPDPFAVAMEAKRYKDAIRLEDVAGKVAVLNAARHDIDIWVLAATSEVGEGVDHGLRHILTEQGVELVTLDWSPSGLPVLGVLLAAQREATLRWLTGNVPSVDYARVEQSLITIKRTSGFTEQRSRLLRQLSAAHIGLGTLQAASNSWLRDRFSDPRSSQRTFGQFVSVANPEYPVQPRGTLVSALGAAVTRLATETVILVHGEEGVGKTWVVAQWWSMRTDQPIMLFVSGRRAELLDPRDPLASLARLLEDQHPTIDSDGWSRRLARWRTTRAEGDVRFVLVLDGVNEHPRMDWADVIRAQVPVLQELGGVVVVTSRTGFWKREIAPRIRGSVAVEPIEVSGYSDRELAAELASVGAVASDLLPHVKEFLRNPRVCSVAKYLLADLAVQPEELTIERVLLEYWRIRLAERGNLARHNIADFDYLLREHAREWLNPGRLAFDRNLWAGFSGAASRAGLESVYDDLTDIEEGRFLTITSPLENTYAFRMEALPYALGLLIASELGDVTRSTSTPVNAAVDETLARMLDPVRGFDRISDIIAAAIGIAGWDKSMPDEVFQALIRGWCSLQNTTSAADAAALRHAAIRPEAVLDVAEQPGRALPPGFQSGILVQLLLDVRDSPSYSTAFERRIPRWLGSWSIEDDFPTLGEDARNHQIEREKRIQSRLAALTEAERSYLHSATVQFHELPETRLQRLSALLMARRPLASYASGLVAWGFAQAIAGSIHHGAEELAWVVSMNRIDPAETFDAVQHLLTTFDMESSPTSQRAIANVLRLLGDDDSVVQAEELYALWTGGPQQQGVSIDPCDPDAEPPSDLSPSHALELVASHDPDEIWISTGLTLEDHKLESWIAPLARFEPEAIVEKIRSIVVTTRSRSRMKLRQIAFRLPALSIIFDDGSLEAVRKRLDLLLDRPEDVDSDDLHWILSNLTAALLPHLTAAEQIDRLQALPNDIPAYFHLGNGLTPPSSDELEYFISDAIRAGDERRLLWLLFHAEYSAGEPTESVRAEVVRLFMRGNELLERIAATFVSQCRDQILNDAVIDECIRHGCPDSWYHRRALAQAIVMNSRTDAVHLVSPEFLGYVAHALGGDSLLRLQEFIDRTLGRALSRDEPTAWEGMDLYLKTSEDGLELLLWGDERRSLDSRETIRELSTSDGAWARQWKESQQRIRNAIEAFERELASAGAQYLASPPPLSGLRELSFRAPSQCREWLSKILETDESQRLSQARNLGLAIAATYGHSDSALAATILRKLVAIPSIYNVIVDGLDLYQYALFSAGAGAEIDALRRETFEQAENDKEIAAIVMAAERYAPDWLNGYTRALTRSASLADRALAITIEGFRKRRSGAQAPSFTGLTVGFLGTARKAASKAARNAVWCEHWLGRAQEAEEPVDFWRFTVLAQKTIDFRHVAEAATALTEGRWARFANPILRDLDKAAEKIAKERGRTLFGNPAPKQELRTMLFPS